MVVLILSSLVVNSTKGIKVQNLLPAKQTACDDGRLKRMLVEWFYIHLYMQVMQP